MRGEPEQYRRKAEQHDREHHTNSVWDLYTFHGHSIPDQVHKRRGAGAACRSSVREAWGRITSLENVMVAAAIWRGYCDRPVFGRTEFIDGLLAAEFDPSDSGKTAEPVVTVRLRPIASSMNRFR
jgi:hypothetical protein